MTLNPRDVGGTLLIAEKLIAAQSWASGAVKKAVEAVNAATTTTTTTVITATSGAVIGGSS